MALVKKEISQSYWLVHASTCLIFQSCLLVWQKWHDFSVGFIKLSYKKLFWKKLFVCKYLRYNILIQHSTRGNVKFTLFLYTPPPPGCAVHAKWWVTQGVNTNGYCICVSPLTVLENGNVSECYTSFVSWGYFSWQIHTFVPVHYIIL